MESKTWRGTFSNEAANAQIEVDEEIGGFWNRVQQEHRSRIDRRFNYYLLIQIY